MCVVLEAPPLSPDRSHYKERLVELINRYRADPAVLFSLAEIKVELQRWHVAVPTRKPEEPEPLYTHRLRMVSDITRWCCSSSTMTSEIYFESLMRCFNHVSFQPITVQNSVSLQTLTNCTPLRKQRCSPVKRINNLCPLPVTVPAGAPPPHVLLSD